MKPISREEKARRDAEVQRHSWNGAKLGLIIFAVTVPPAVYFEEYWWSTGYALLDMITFLLAWGWIFICMGLGDRVASHLNREVYKKVHGHYWRDEPSGYVEDDSRWR